VVYSTPLAGSINWWDLRLVKINEISCQFSQAAGIFRLRFI
jgi:hypothetical protein